jgi:hypothetical protein
MESRSFITNTFQTLWRSGIHTTLKIDAEALHRRRLRFCVCRITCHIYQWHRRQYAGKCARVYGVCIVKNKIGNEASYRQYFQPNLTQPNLKLTQYFQTP